MSNIVFITRTLEKGSFLRQELEEHEIPFYDFSLIDFRPVPFVDFPDTDWLFFNSKKGVKTFIENIKAESIVLRPEVKFACIGRSTAGMIREYGYPVHFNPAMSEEENYSADEVCRHFANCIKSQEKVLVIRGKQSNLTLKNFTPNGQYHDLITYENTRAVGRAIPHHHLAVITSGANAGFYREKYMGPVARLISIGTKTSETMQELGMETDYTCSTPYEKSIWQTLSKILSQRKD